MAPAPTPVPVRARKAVLPAELLTVERCRASAGNGRREAGGDQAVDGSVELVVQVGVFNCHSVEVNASALVDGRDCRQQ